MQIIYEDNHLIAVSKPFCMPSQGDQSQDLSVFDWVKAYIKEKYNKPGKVYLALLHRLDRPTGGILILGKTSKAAERMSKQFQAKTIQKVYYAITEQAPHPRQGTLKHYLRKLADKNIMRAYQKEVAHSKYAELDYLHRGQVGARSLVQIWPKTGRRHQIRVQLASVGAVIRGDVKYGKTQFNPDKSIALLAKSIRFEHPTLKKEIQLSIPIPDNEIWAPFKAFDSPAPIL